MTKALSGKPVFPKTVFIVQVAYQRYAFDSIDLAARFIDSVSSATPVSRDYKPQTVKIVQSNSTRNKLHPLPALKW